MKEARNLRPAHRVGAAVLLACGSYFLAPVGAAVAQKLDVAPLKRIFGLLLLGLGLKMLFSVL